LVPTFAPSSANTVVDSCSPIYERVACENKITLGCWFSTKSSVCASIKNMTLHFPLPPGLPVDHTLFGAAVANRLGLSPALVTCVSTAKYVSYITCEMSRMEY
jgi:hypothetical protein